MIRYASITEQCVATYLVTSSTARRFEVAVMSAAVYGIILVVVEVYQVHQHVFAVGTGEAVWMPRQTTCVLDGYIYRPLLNVHLTRRTLHLQKQDTTYAASVGRHWASIANH